MRKGTIQPDSLEGRLEKRIARKRGDVFLRADFDDLGGYDQGHCAGLSARVG